MTALDFLTQYEAAAETKTLKKVLDSTDRSTISYYSNWQDCDAEFRGVSRV
jgi:hypothetical protein